MAPRHHFATEIPQSVFDEQDVFDDSINGMPVPTITTPRELGQRFMRRLAELTAASVSMEEERSGASVNIILSRNPGSPHSRIELNTKLKSFLQSLKSSLELIAQHRDGNAFEQAKDEMMDSILMFSFLNVEHVVQSLQRLFRDKHDQYSEMVTQIWASMLGINAQAGARVDTEVGDAVMRLQQLTQSYQRTPGQLHTLIQTASGMTNQIPYLPDRLKYLIRRPKFTDELYQLICTLGTPERAHQTFVRTAQTSQSFRRVRITTRPNPPSPTRVRFSPSPPPRSTKAAASPPRSALRVPNASARSTTATPATSPGASSVTSSSMPMHTPQRQPQQPFIQLEEDRPPGPRTTSPASSASDTVPQRFRQTSSTGHQTLQALSSQDTDIYAVVRPYLPEEDRHVGIHRLQPQVKQEVAQLAAAVLRRNLVPVKARVWSTFGFVTVRDIEEKRHLAGLYAAILEEAVDKQWVFREFMRAVETNTLPELFNRSGYSHFREVFPRLESFLSTPPANRPTVWLLKHFLHDEDNTEPPAVLQRDYGFRYCRHRDEVSRLKTIYAAILKNADSLDLHTACTHGRLVEFAALKGVFVDHKDKRLMQNDYPASFIGFDNDLGLAAYRGSFFRRRL